MLLDGAGLTAYTPNARGKLALMLPHTARAELTTCFDVAAAGRYPTPGGWAFCPMPTGSRWHDALCLVRAEELEDRDFARISDGQRQRAAGPRGLPAAGDCFWTSQRRFGRKAVRRNSWTSCKCWHMRRMWPSS